MRVSGSESGKRVVTRRDACPWAARHTPDRCDRDAPARRAPWRPSRRDRGCLRGIRAGGLQCFLLSAVTMFATLVSPAALFLLALSAADAARAQVVVNGQIFTNGLAIVDAPQPGT